MNNTCATCKHWKPIKKTDYSFPGVGEFGECWAFPFSSRSFIDDTLAQICTHATGNDDIAIVTRQDFGCALHEERE